MGIDHGLYRDRGQRPRGAGGHGGAGLWAGRQGSPFGSCLSAHDAIAAGRTGDARIRSEYYLGMAVPDFASLMLPLLQSLADGAEHGVASLRDQLSTGF